MFRRHVSVIHASRRLANLALALGLLAAPGAGAQAPTPLPAGAEPVGVRVPLVDDRPLPDTAWLIEQVRSRLKTDSELLSSYTYRERRQRIDVGRLGGVSLGPLREFEVYPSSVPGETYKRLVAVDGDPLDPETLARNDRIHRQNQEKRRRELAEESPEERAERLAALAKAEEEEQAILDDGFEVFEIELVGRELIDGRPMLVADLTPRADSEPRTRVGQTMKHMQGRAWVDEQDFELARAEVEVISDVRIGWGILGRLHAGSELYFERTHVNDEIWLPSVMRTKMSGRTLLFRTFDLEATTEYWDYRKCDVETSVAGSRPDSLDERHD